ncbi:glutathione peroxidase [Fulvitalea axinellae]|uniref:Glutathione peroxidase n=1 Tax=Fulvitalea axinellae TaxID=1182444 RepID=A0AAU9CSE8_9BACT|nr:glutathione peroxidase [Fulvitalea axinellae]
MASVYDFKVKDIRGKEVSLEEYKGKVLLIVNTASKCGLTPQYKGLEELYKELNGQGLEVLGFPCNQFGGQEPGSEEEIGQFCELNYGVSFPMFSKIDVNGSETHPLYEYLKSEKKGVLGTKAIKWNFTKFLIDKEGRVIERFSPTTEPAKIKGAIEKLL